jgi:hypothetical protein
MERLYEHCSAASALCVRLTMAAQVYGGSLSLVVGAYLWSSSSQEMSVCSAGVTVVSRLLTELNNNRFSGSRAGTYNIYGALQPHNHTFRMRGHVTDCAHSIRTQAARRQAPTCVVRSDYHARPFSFDVTREQAMGGAVAIVAGAFVYSTSRENFGQSSFGSTYMQDCRVAVSGSSFTDCEAVSLTSGPALGTASVYGGALSVLHSPQVSTFVVETSPLPPTQAELAGFNVTFFVSRCSFSACSAVTNSTSVVPGAASGGGGALYFGIAAFANVSLQSSSFSSCFVVVAIGAIGFPASNSSGGGVLVDILNGSNVTSASVLLLSNTFWNCSANGAGQYSPFTAVRGGGVAVSRAAAIKVLNTSFSTCSVSGASSVSVVSGGAGLSAVLVPSVSLTGCSFDGAASQDSSGTSAGLLVLPSGAAPAIIAIDSCSLFSSIGTVILNITCVDAATGLNSAACVQPGPAVSASNSNISQLAPATDGSDFSSIGSAMVSLQQNVSVMSTNSLLVCNSTQFAVFRKSLFPNVVYSCSPCPNLQVSLTSNAVLLDTVSPDSAAPLIAQCIPLPSATSCPSGIAACTTSVNVTSGFWAEFSNLTTWPLTDASQCPAGYCACGDNPSCLLPPPLSNAANPNPLCSGNRSGVLCGGCVSGFTQSLDGRTCISNEVCSQNLWWVWTLSILWWAAFGLGIVVSSSGQSSGAISCVLFFFQISSLASIETSRSRSGPKWAVVVAQFGTIFSLTSMSCWAPDMSAYDVTAAKLIGPCFVLLFSIAWTRLLSNLKPRLQRHGVDMDVSYSGTFAVTLLFVFSNVSSVVFALVTCTSDGKVFIDGNVECYNTSWRILIGVVVILCFVPIAFAGALLRNKLPEQARCAVCRAYTERLFYWGAVTLAFRLLMFITPLIVKVQYPNVSAFVHLVLSGMMCCVLVHMQPYVAVNTFWIDVCCYLCLGAQFGLQTISSTRDALGTLQQPTFFDSVEVCSVVFR